MHATALIAQPHSAVVTVRGGSDGWEARGRRDAPGTRCCDSHLRSPSPCVRIRRRGVHAVRQPRPLTRAYEHGGVRVRARAALVPRSRVRSRAIRVLRRASRVVEYDASRATRPATRKHSHPSRSHSQFHARSRTWVENERARNLANFTRPN